MRNEPVVETTINEMAALHASQIEAACWTPRSKMTDDDYKVLTMSKTIELCQAIIQRSLKSGDQAKLQLLVFVTNQQIRSAQQQNARPPPPPQISNPEVKPQLFSEYYDNQVDSDHGSDFYNPHWDPEAFEPIQS